MKLPLYSLLLAPLLALAQPQSPADASREQRAAQREYLREQGYTNHDRDNDWRLRRYCREWRERVERHPRLRLPRECWGK